MGEVQLEFVQLVEDPSIYRDWLDEHGEGFHNGDFLVDDADEAVDILTEQGFESLQGGKLGPREQKAAYNYVDISPLRTIWEPVYIGEEIGAELRMHPLRATVGKNAFRLR